MKAIIKWSLVALVILPLACSKTKGSEDEDMDMPATKELAQVIKFNKPVAIDAKSLNSIELTEASRYIIEYDQTKADWGTSILYGTYRYSNGTFILQGFGSLKINGNQVTITPLSAEGDSIEANATITPITTSDDINKNACRNWKIGQIIFGMSGGEFGQAGIEKVFNNGINMKEITEWASEYFTISQADIESVSGYSVKEICMTGSGSFVISFSGEDPFYGSFDITGSTFSFVFDEDDIPFISNGKLNGSISFSGPTCKIEAAATVVYERETYNATLEMELHEIK